MPLEGYRLLDLSRLVPGPTASHLLADMGMEVIKVEEPEPRGGMGRDNLDPALSTPETEVQDSAFNATARNKKSIAIDLQSQEGRQVLYRLVRTADVFLEAYRPGVVKRLGCDYDTLSKINPRLVYCSLSGYGQDGPYAAIPSHDINQCSVAGLLSLQWEEAGTPVENAVPIAGIAGSVYAVIGIQAALLSREKTGRGQFVDVSLTHSVMTWMISNITNYFRTGQKSSRGVPKRLSFMECKDGKFLTLANSEAHFWESFCKAIGRPDFIPLHRVTLEQHEQYAVMVKEVKALMLTKTRDEWFEILVQAGTCVAPVLEIDEVFENAANRHRGMLLELEHPVMGKVRQIGPVIKFSDTPFEFRNFAPVLGEQTEGILQEIGYTPEEIAALEGSGAVKAWKKPEPTGTHGLM